MQWRRDDGYGMDDSNARLDRDAIHRWLVDAYWCFGLPRDVLDRSIENSVCFGVYEFPEGSQVGFCRVVSDRATFAWVADVFVAEHQRGRGLAVWLMQVVAAHPDLQGLRRWLLGTRDAHDLYRKTGYRPLTPEQIERFMGRPTEADYGPGSGQFHHNPARSRTERVDNRRVKVSAKADYALRAAAELAAAAAGPMKAERISDAQDIPIKFLESILLELKHAGIVRSQRGPDGGYSLARPATEISLADVIRAVDGPLANVRGDRPENVTYAGPAVRLTDIWIAVRASLRHVLESTSLADLAAGELRRDSSTIWPRTPRPGSRSAASAAPRAAAARAA